MATTYEDIIDRDLQVIPNARAARSDAVLENELARSPGGRVRSTCNRNGWTPASNMREILDELHNELRRANWKWRPGEAGSDGRAVLDGRRDSGECRYLANALRALLVAPAPYGFGVDRAAVAVVRYEGSARNGFIAEHKRRPEAWFGLTSNVYDRTFHCFTELYYWPNHQVLQFQNAYFDVCYNEIYAQLSDMAHIELGPLRSEIENGVARGEYRGRSQHAAHDAKYWRLATDPLVSPEAVHQLEGPYDKSLYWF